eukprot:scaffold187_cov329-Pavlova_lutheri.AAC.12
MSQSVPIPIANLKHLLKCVQHDLGTVRVDQQVVEVASDCALVIDEVMKPGIHHALEGSNCVAHAHNKYQPLK